MHHLLKEPGVIVEYGWSYPVGIGMRQTEMSVTRPNGEKYTIIRMESGLDTLDYSRMYSFEGKSI